MCWFKNMHCSEIYVKGGRGGRATYSLLLFYILVGPWADPPREICAGWPIVVRHGMLAVGYFNSAHEIKT